MNKIIKEIKTIWIDGGFTSIAIASILTIVIVSFLPEGNNIMKDCHIV
jgi:hypothetical protein